MRVTIQRVLNASVTVGGEVVGSIERGILVLVGISRDDTEAHADYLCRKLLNLRLWADTDAPDGKSWSASVMQRKFDVLLVSQFTLYGVPKGNKPDFHLAMGPELAETFYARFVAKVAKEYKGGRVQNGKFGADMQVALVNDGPVTISLETDSMDFSKEDEKAAKAAARWNKNKAPGTAAGAELHSESAPPTASVVSPAPPPQTDGPTASTSPSPSASSSPASSPAVAAPANSSSSAPSSQPRKQKQKPVPSPPPAAAPLVAASIPSTGFDSLVGNTSLILLRQLSEETGCKIYGKAEFENPGGSVKDRPAMWIVRKAEEEGKLVPGKPGYIVEGTAGNTGIGLCLAGASRGYQSIIVMPGSNTQEKKDALRYLGATLVEVPTVPFTDDNNYVHVGQRVYENMKKKFEGTDTKVILADQWSNPANRQSHFEGTGPEIWAQTGGKIDVFCCGIGTGGTLSGTGMYLRSKKPDIRLVLIDPPGSGMKDYYEQGEVKWDPEGTTVAEGIGQQRLCDNLIRDGFRPDECIRISDQEAFPYAYDLLKHEGLCVGTSSAINICGAYRIAKRLGPGHTIVTILADHGLRYISKMFNPDFLKEKKLPTPSWLDPDNKDAQERNKLAKEMLEHSLIVD